ncbi:MAG: hypothetical protein AAFU64_12320 [Bacteroidota bacterium]
MLDLNQRRVLILGLGLCGITLLLSYCRSHQETSEQPKAPESMIRPPLPKLDISYQSYTFQASEGDTLKYKTGTEIFVPGDAFVDSSGQSVSGQVEIQYREFHNSLDVLLSGIPMAYDSAGVQTPLQTAGMFDIQALQGTQARLNAL